MSDHVVFRDANGFHAVASSELKPDANIVEAGLTANDAALRVSALNRRFGYSVADERYTG
jgi:hypothetical protein